MKAYSPPTNKGRHVAGHDVHHRTADQPKGAASKRAKHLKKAARQHAKQDIDAAIDMRGEVKP